jgi:hypothetical protein
MNEAGWVTVALSVLTLATIVANAVIQRMREVRQRRWDVEDRKAAAAASAQHTQNLHGAIEESRRSIGQAVAANIAVSVQSARDIKDNTAKTVEAKEAAAAAYVEANGMNKKLEQLGLRIKDAAEKKHGA